MTIRVRRSQTEGSADLQPWRVVVRLQPKEQLHLLFSYPSPAPRLLLSSPIRYSCCARPQVTHSVCGGRLVRRRDTQCGIVPSSDALNKMCLRTATTSKAGTSWLLYNLIKIWINGVDSNLLITVFHSHSVIWPVWEEAWEEREPVDSILFCSLVLLAVPLNAAWQITTYLSDKCWNVHWVGGKTHPEGHGGLNSQEIGHELLKLLMDAQVPFTEEITTWKWPNTSNKCLTQGSDRISSTRDGTIWVTTNTETENKLINHTDYLRWNGTT